MVPVFFHNTFPVTNGFFLSEFFVLLDIMNLNTLGGCMCNQKNAFFSGVTLVFLLMFGWSQVFAKPNLPYPVFDHRDWVLALVQNTETSRLLEYTLKNESIDNWSELVTLHFFQGRFDLKTFASTWYKAMEVQHKCDAALALNERDPNRGIVFYQNCGSSEDAESGVAVFVLEPSVGIHAFIYEKRGYITDDELNTWLINLVNILPKGKN